MCSYFCSKCDLCFVCRVPIDKHTRIQQKKQKQSGTCQGCPVAFVSLTTSITASAKAYEGVDANVTYRPSATPTTTTLANRAEAETETDALLPDCPALPGPWQTLPDKQIDPACSPAEDQGSLGTAATAAECLALAKSATGDSSVNYAVWRGDQQDKQCEGCAFRWRGPAENWKFSALQGATSFANFQALPAPKPSGPCPLCPSDPPSMRTETHLTTTLSNGRIQATFGPRGLNTLR